VVHPADGSKGMTIDECRMTNNGILSVFLNFKIEGFVKSLNFDFLNI
jgi:hypothetical protein